MSKNTGGPAFPRDHAHDGHNGMDLRDYFAAKALAPLIAAMVEDISEPQFEMVLAAQSYLIADAMLKEREK